MTIEPTRRNARDTAQLSRWNLFLWTQKAGSLTNHEAINLMSSDRFKKVTLCLSLLLLTESCENWLVWQSFRCYFYNRFPKGRDYPNDTWSLNIFFGFGNGKKISEKTNANKHQLHHSGWLSPPWHNPISISISSLFNSFFSRNVSLPLPSSRDSDNDSDGDTFFPVNPHCTVTARNDNIDNIDTISRTLPPTHTIHLCPTDRCHQQHHLPPP